FLLLNWQLPTTKVAESKQNTQHRNCPVRYLLEFLRVNRESEFEISGRDSVIDVSVIPLAQAAVWRSRDPTYKRSRGLACRKQRQVYAENKRENSPAAHSREYSEEAVLGGGFGALYHVVRL